MWRHSGIGGVGAGGRRSRSEGRRPEEIRSRSKCSAQATTTSKPITSRRPWAAQGVSGEDEATGGAKIRHEHPLRRSESKHPHQQGFFTVTNIKQKNMMGENLPISRDRRAQSIVGRRHSVTERPGRGCVRAKKRR